MEIGMKIYYDVNNGNVIVNTGERFGSVVETSWEQDFLTYAALEDRLTKTVGMLQLEYGEHQQDFAICNGYKVNIETEKLEFSYPDPNESEAPQEPVYEKPLTEQIATLQQRTEANEAAILALLDFGL
ncbi:hypothetical protein NYE33_07890 [Paenibacillus sp. FSL R10-2199]|uniref:hypothetical protein n=1 Tax=Paenibacillus sp. FSL R10-2199 TaxID=2975348 RepID=UPI0030F58D76